MYEVSCVVFLDFFQVEKVSFYWLFAEMVFHEWCKILLNAFSASTVPSYYFFAFTC